VDSKNAGALTYGSEHVLTRFANLPDAQNDVGPPEDFRQQFGELFPGLGPQDYWIEVVNFRAAWRAKTSHQKEVVSGYLTRLLNRSRRPHVKEPQGELAVFTAYLARDPRYFPQLKVDFSDGKIKSAPAATLLDWLANALLEHRHKLGICAREGCTTPYFVKSHPRGRYCSESCFRASRLEKKNQWFKRNRGAGSRPAVGSRRGKTPKKSAKGGRR
jgi:hypothetical protein